MAADDQADQARNIVRTHDERIQIYRGAIRFLLLTTCKTTCEATRMPDALLARCRARY